MSTDGHFSDDAPGQGNPFLASNPMTSFFTTFRELLSVLQEQEMLQGHLMINTLALERQLAQETASLNLARAQQEADAQVVEGVMALASAISSFASASNPGFQPRWENPPAGSQALAQFATVANANQDASAETIKAMSALSANLTQNAFATINETNQMVRQMMEQLAKIAEQNLAANRWTA